MLCEESIWLYDPRTHVCEESIWLYDPRTHVSEESIWLYNMLAEYASKRQLGYIHLNIQTKQVKKVDKILPEQIATFNK